MEKIAGLRDEIALYLLLDVLEHIENDQDFVDKLVGRAASGAHFLLTVPADPGLWSAHDDASHHFRRYEASSLARLWVNLPVDIRLFTALNTRLYPLVWTIRNSKRRLGLDHRGSDLSMPPSLINRILENIFAGERRRVIATLDAKPETTPRRGVSFLLLARRR